MDQVLFQSCFIPSIKSALFTCVALIHDNSFDDLNFRSHARFEWQADQVKSSSLQTERKFQTFFARSLLRNKLDLLINPSLDERQAFGKQILHNIPKLYLFEIAGLLLLSINIDFAITLPQYSGVLVTVYMKCCFTVSLGARSYRYSEQL